MSKYSLTSLFMMVFVFFLCAVVDKIVAQSPWDVGDLAMVTILSISCGGLFFSYKHKL